LTIDSLTFTIEKIMRDLIHRHGTQGNVARKIGIAEESFSRKLSGQAGWMPQEIAAVLAEGGYTLIKSEELTALRVFAKKGLETHGTA